MYEHLTQLLGLEGFRVTAFGERGEALEFELELEPRGEHCPRCRSQALEVKERPLVRLRDLPLAGRAAFLHWRKRRYRCRACAKSFTESHPALPPRQRVSRRFRRHLFERTREGAAHAEVARLERTSRYQVARAFSEGADELLAEGARVLPARRLSLDEAKHRRPRRYATVVSDPDSGRVRELVPGRSRESLEGYLRSLSVAEREAIACVSIDPWPAYRKALAACLPGAKVVCDPFHLVAGANAALDTVRRGSQRERRAKRRGVRQAGRSGYRRELFQARHRLLKAGERLTPDERRSLERLFAGEPALAEAWALKEAFRSVYRAPDRAEAERRLERFLASCDRSSLRPFQAFARGLSRWRQELLAYFEEPLTNGYAEGVTNKMKTIARRAYGLPSFPSFRRRVLVACG